MKKNCFMLTSIVSRLYHTLIFPKRGRLGLTRNVHARHGEKRYRESNHAGHVTQNSTRIVMPGMKMNEMSRKKRAIE